MTATSGFIVPANAVRAGGNYLSKQLVADAAISPTNLVKYDTSGELVIVCPADDEYCIGVAGQNHQAIADGEDPMTHAFADGELVPVHMDGYLVVVADAAAMTRGLLARTGAADGAECQDSGHVTWEPMVIGRNMTTAASAAKGVIKFF